MGIKQGKSRYKAINVSKLNTRNTVHRLLAHSSENSGHILKLKIKKFR